MICACPLVMLSMRQETSNQELIDRSFPASFISKVTLGSILAAALASCSPPAGSVSTDVYDCGPPCFSSSVYSTRANSYFVSPASYFVSPVPGELCGRSGI